MNSGRTRTIKEIVSEILARTPDVSVPVEKRLLCDANCTHCGGSGFVTVVETMEGWSGPEEIKRTAICPRRMEATRIGAAGLLDSDLNKGWKDLINTGNIRAAEKAVRSVCDGGCGWVYLHGAPGLAKTVMLKIAVAEWLRRGGRGAYTTMSAILDNLRAAYDADHPSEEAVARLARWESMPLLAIDEFDRIKPTEFAQERQFRLMDARYDAAINARASVTLMASNQPPEALDPYLADRIRDGRFVVVRMEGESLRPGMEWQK